SETLRSLLCQTLLIKETTDEKNYCSRHKECHWPEGRDSLDYDRHRFGRSLEPAMSSERRGRDSRAKPPEEYSAQLHTAFCGSGSCSDCDRSRHPFALGEGTAHRTRPRSSGG